ncbi:hypothetical protein SANA_30330 [Gottschalkiaceae bacterium SANA]|nr:hypothetical protein SANA_30330 [Gottschalkiaceae bacterium SANA]
MESWLLKFQEGKRAHAPQEELVSILMDGMNQIEGESTHWVYFLGAVKKRMRQMMNFGRIQREDIFNLSGNKDDFTLNYQQVAEVVWFEFLVDLADRDRLLNFDASKAKFRTYVCQDLLAPDNHAGYTPRVDRMILEALGLQPFKSRLDTSSFDEWLSDDAEAHQQMNAGAYTELDGFDELSRYHDLVLNRVTRGVPERLAYLYGIWYTAIEKMPNVNQTVMQELSDESLFFDYSRYERNVRLRFSTDEVFAHNRCMTLMKSSHGKILLGESSYASHYKISEGRVEPPVMKLDDSVQKKLVKQVAKWRERVKGEIAMFWVEGGADHAY